MSAETHVKSRNEEKRKVSNISVRFMTTLSEKFCLAEFFGFRITATPKSQLTYDFSVTVAGKTPLFVGDITLEI